MAERSGKPVYPRWRVATLGGSQGVVANTAGTFGNSGYNALTGPGFFMADASVNRTCRIHERQRIEMRLEFFNVLNHTNMSGPAAITLLP